VILAPALLSLLGAAIAETAPSAVLRAVRNAQDVAHDKAKERVASMLEELTEVASEWRRLEDNNENGELQDEIATLIAHGAADALVLTEKFEMSGLTKRLRAIASNERDSSEGQSERIYAALSEATSSSTNVKWYATIESDWAIPLTTLLELLRMEAETSEIDEDVITTTTAEIEFVSFKWAVSVVNALANWMDQSRRNEPKHYDHWRTAISDLMAFDGGRAPYLVFMTLEGHGVGIWDGSWEPYFEGDQIKALEEVLREELDDAHQEFKEALMETVLQMADKKKKGKK
jgi:hypothetical protein